MKKVIIILITFFVINSCSYHNSQNDYFDEQDKFVGIWGSDINGQINGAFVIYKDSSLKNHYDVRSYQYRDFRGNDFIKINDSILNEMNAVFLKYNSKDNTLTFWLGKEKGFVMTKMQ